MWSEETILTPSRTATQIANILQVPLVGNPMTEAHKIRPLDYSDGGSLTFCTYRKGKDTTSMVKMYRPAITICDVKLKDSIGEPQGPQAFIFVENAKAAFNYLLMKLLGRPRQTFREWEWGVRVADCVKIGNNVAIYPGTVIGHPGLGPVHDYHDNTKWVQFRDIGNVVIGDNVQIGANCAIARAPLASTIIEDGVKIANMTNIGHNAHIKRGAIITSMCMVARGTIGENAWLAPGCTILPGVNVGANALVGTGAVVTKNVPEDKIVAGNPARIMGDRKGLV